VTGDLGGRELSSARRLASREKCDFPADFRSVREGVLARRLAKEDRYLRIAPRFFDRYETPAIFVTSLVLTRARWFVMSSGVLSPSPRPPGPLLPSICRFRLAHTASRMLAGNWSTKIQIPDDQKIAQRCGAAIAVSASAGSAFLSPLKILSFWKRSG